MEENGEEETNGDYENQENLQKKLYFMNEQLQLMVQDIPIKHQQRFPNELLCGLAECLLDETIFGIVEQLMDIQHTAEKQLSRKRLRVMHEHTSRLKFLKESPLSEEVKNIKKNILMYRYKKKMKNCDREIIKILDMKRRDQQVVLKSVVPAFQETDDPRKIQVQMRLLDFIFRLDKKMKERFG